MYNLTELLAHRPTPANVCWAKPRLFFTIYYKVGDDAFRHASDTWKRAVQLQEHFTAGYDSFVEKGISTESQFKTAWTEISIKAAQGRYQVWAGNVLSHASKQTDSNDGLEFAGDETDDGTLKQGEIAALDKLPWSPHGYLLLCGCNTGLGGARGWTPAQAFAARQGVPTVGQMGYAYFSKDWSSYTKKSEGDTKISLWAYQRGKNGMLGSGCRMLGKIYK